MDNLASTKIKISEQLKYVKRQENLSPQQDDSMKHHSMMLEACTSEGKIADPSIQCNFEGAESPDFPVTMKEQQ